MFSKVLRFFNFLFRPNPTAPAISVENTHPESKHFRFPPASKTVSSFDHLKLVRHLYWAKCLQQASAAFHSSMEEIERSEWMVEGLESGNIILNYLPFRQGECRPKVMGEFAESGDYFCSCRHFAAFCDFLPKAHHQHWNRLRQLSSRNILFFRLLSLLRELQQDFFHSGDFLDLYALSQTEALKQYLRQYPGDYFEASMISRLLKGKPRFCWSGRILNIKDLFPSRSLWMGRHIQDLLRIYPQMNDQALHKKLEERLQIKITVRTVTGHRNSMGIPPLHKRQSGKMETVRFSSPVPLSSEYARRYPKQSGVYRILQSGNFLYPEGASPVIYIGASQDIYSRLKTYYGGFAHTEEIKHFLATYPTQISYCLNADPKGLESRLIHDFESRMGDLPRFNKLRPKMP